MRDREDDALDVWTAGDALDRCIASAAARRPANSADEALVERVWQDVLLNRFGAHEALAEMLKASEKVRRAFNGDCSLAQFRDRYEYDEDWKSFVGECLQFVADRLTGRRHRKNSPFEAGLDFQRWDELKGYLLARNPTDGRLALAADFIREHEREWRASKVEDRSEYASDGRGAHDMVQDE